MPSTDKSDPSNHLKDPIRHGAQLIAGNEFAALERRLKEDIFRSLCRIKPELARYDFETDIMTGKLFQQLSAPLQGIAIAKTEGALAFYNRIGWAEKFLETPLDACITDETGKETLRSRYHARNLHDLAYVHPRHFEKIFGKVGAASLWEMLKSEAGCGNLMPGNSDDTQADKS